MHLIPFMIQMVAHLLSLQDSYKVSEDKSDFTYVHEKRLSEFLEEGMK